MTLNTWYIYQNNQQLGPFEQSQIQQLLATKMIAHESHIFKAGWVEWRLGGKVFSMKGANSIVMNC